jgi:hypothetical protein
MIKQNLCLTALIALLTPSILCAQIDEAAQVLPGLNPTKQSTKVNFQASDNAKGNRDVEVLWSEDFSNGIEGQGDNGAWTTSGPEGDLWFQTFPIGAANGYNPEAPLDIPAYGPYLPNYFTFAGIGSSTASNGFMMLDGDRFNSTATSPDDPDAPNTLQNSITSYLTSPPIDLSGVENANLNFHRTTRFCCVQSLMLVVEISTNNGDSWTPLIFGEGEDELNETVDEEVTISISDILSSSDDLFSVIVRFPWPDEQSHYYYMLDDVAISATPANELIAGETWYNNHHQLLPGFDNGNTSATAYYSGMEYFNMPSYAAHTFNFAMEVTNAGLSAQYNSVMEVTVTTPSGQEFMLSSSPVTIPAGITDTLTIPAIELDESIPLETGQYSFDYVVNQTQNDENPLNNNGPGKSVKISDDGPDNEPAIFRNDGNNVETTYLGYGQDVIWGTAYTFPESSASTTQITHVEAVFLNWPDYAETEPGNAVYFNVREGSILEEDPMDPESISTVVFDSQNPLTYDDPDLLFLIEEDDIWNINQGSDLIWASFELPEPITVEAGKIYQAEYRVPPASGSIVFPPVTKQQETYASFLFDYSGVQPQWFNLGQNAIPKRFRTQQICQVQDTITETSCISYEFNGTVYNESGEYEQVVEDTTGCVTTFFLDLTILNGASTTNLITETACNVFSLNGQDYTESGEYTQTLTNAAGCDSIITLNLTVQSANAATITETACDSYTYNEVEYTESGTYTQLLTNSAGCDSIVTLNLTIPQNDITQLEITACESYTLNGETYTESGSYTQVLTNEAGCDSTLNLELTIPDPGSGLCDCSTDEITLIDSPDSEFLPVCPTDTAMILWFEAFEFPINGGYALRFTPVGGGVAFYHSVEGNALSLDNSGDGYIMTDLESGDEQILEGEYEIKGLAFTDSSDIANSICAETQLERSILFYTDETVTDPPCTIVGLDHRVDEFGWAIYPNPASDMTTLQFDGQMNGPANIRIVDLSGKEVYQNKLQMSNANKRLQISTSNLKAGTYIVIYTDGNKSTAQKLIISK